MPSKVSLNRPSVGRPQMESRARGAAEARKRHLPTPGNTRVHGDGERASRGGGSTRKASQVAVQRDRPLSKSGVRESMQRVRREAAQRPARSLRVASAGLSPDSPGVRQVARDTGGSVSLPESP
jgi:hypothetical protein